MSGSNEEPEKNLEKIPETTSQKQSTRLRDLIPEIPNLEVAHRRAGKVKRWHTEPTIQQQTLSDHIFNMLRIYMAIWGEPPPAIVMKIMYHDFEELYLGDLPHWAAQIPDLKIAYLEVEHQLQHEYQDILSATHRYNAFEYRIKICDWIEALEFMLEEILLGNSRMRLRMEKLYQKLERLLKDEYRDEEPVLRYLDDTNFARMFNLAMDGIHRGQE